MRGWPEHVAGQTVHARRGEVKNTFRYGIDYVLIDPLSRRRPFLFSRNGWNLMAVNDRDHGGPRGAGRGVGWADDVFAERGFDTAAGRVHLLAQPSFVGSVFNPVSFWLLLHDSALIAVIAEVNNTDGERHSYFCAKPDRAPILPDDTLRAAKVFHVSPFQDVDGHYEFNFNVTDKKIAIRIAFLNGNDGLIATFSGKRRALSNASILSASFRRPAGALRTLGMIYWQALRLKAKKVRYRRRPVPPREEVS